MKNESSVNTFVSIDSEEKLDLHTSGSYKKHKDDKWKKKVNVGKFTILGPKGGRRQAWGTLRQKEKE